MKKLITGITASLLLASSTLLSPASAEDNRPLTLLKDAQAAENVSLQGYDAYGFFNEEEPNNTFTQANQIILDDIVVGSFGKDDSDFYKLEIENEELVYIFAGRYDEQPLAAQMELKLFDSNQALIQPGELDIESGDIYSTYQLSPGTYYISVKDALNLGKNEKYAFVTSQLTIEPYVHRIEGGNRYETALNIAYEGWFGVGANEIILTTGTNFPDALAGAPLAYYKDAPILLTTKDKLHPTVEEAISELDVQKVTILGGTSAVSSTVEKRLKDLGVRIERIAGTDRYSTALAIAAKLPASDSAVVVNGKNYPDALSIASFAAQNGYPILLADKDSIGTATLNKAKSYESNIVIGGDQAISNTVFKKLNSPTRISGKDRYETSVNVAQSLDMYYGYAFVATGTQFADALTGSALAAYYSEPLVLTTPDKLHAKAKGLFATSPIGFTILGGTSAVSTKVEDELNLLIAE